MQPQTPPQVTNQPPAANPGQTTQPISPAGGPVVPPQMPVATSRNRGGKKGNNDFNSTQNTLLISEIRDGMVIMKDGSLRAVIMCQSINFDLMSPQERESVEYNYQAFLNSLFFPIQIYIRSQRIDLDNYIQKLQTIHSEQDNMLLALLMEDYIAYVEYIIEAAHIMDKQFYIVVPYYPSLLSQAGLATNARKLTATVTPKHETIVINETDFARYKSELTQQVQVILNGMNQLGVQSIPLNTQELIELYYGFYNPQTATAQHLTDINELEAPVVEKGRGEPPRRGDEH